MSIETRVFDPSTYLDSDTARATYMTDAFETGDPAFIADALRVAARARGATNAMKPPIGHMTSLRSVLYPRDAELAHMLRTLHALGLRLTVQTVVP